MPSWPIVMPLSVKYVTPDEPVRTSTDWSPRNVIVRPSLNSLPAPTRGSSWPSTQTFSQAGRP